MIDWEASSPSPVCDIHFQNMIRKVTTENPEPNYRQPKSRSIKEAGQKHETYISAIRNKVKTKPTDFVYLQFTYMLQSWNPGLPRPRLRHLRPSRAFVKTCCRIVFSHHSETCFRPAPRPTHTCYVCQRKQTTNQTKFATYNGNQTMSCHHQSLLVWERSGLPIRYSQHLSCGILAKVMLLHGLAKCE